MAIGGQRSVKAQALQNCLAVGVFFADGFLSPLTAEG